MLLSPTDWARSDGGFTLIELLIVVATIGILASIAAISLSRARQSGNEASAIGSMRADQWSGCLRLERRREVRPEERLAAAAETCNASAENARAMYHVAADPVGRGVNGTRSFGSDRRGTIYYSSTASIPNPIPGGLDFLQ